MPTSDWPEVVTPKQIAERLRIKAARPDKTVREFLRREPPIPHVPYERWEFTPQQAEEIVRRWHDRH
jgi:hypothetical protein